MAIPRARCPRAPAKSGARPRASSGPPARARGRDASRDRASAPPPQIRRCRSRSSACAAAAFPDLKLQGIFYNPNNPKIIINGENPRAERIHRRSAHREIFPSEVTVQWNGRTKDLLLEPP